MVFIMEYRFILGAGTLFSC